jgi:hypothetical protein
VLESPMNSRNAISVCCRSLFLGIVSFEGR